MLRHALVTCFLFLILPDGASLAADQAERPNILWITTEDMSPNLGCFGDPFARTPRLDAFARESVRFTSVYATAPVCSPARASLITGMYATTLGNPHLRCQVPFPDEVKGLGAFFRAAGYFTSNNVKTDYSVADKERFIGECWNASSTQAHWRLRPAGSPFFSVFNFMETHQSRSSSMPWEDFEKEIGSRLAPENRADATKVPLPPFYPDTPLARRTMARYYDCISVMDSRVGSILDELAKDGLADDTIVCFFSDHGMGMPRGKRVLQDSGMHVPLLVRYPEKFKHLAPAAPGAAVDRLISFVDFAPTMLHLAGLPLPAHMQGIPFSGVKTDRERQSALGARDRVDEVRELSRSLREKRWLYIRNYMPHLSWMQPEATPDASDFKRELRTLAKAGTLKPEVMTYAAPRKAREELYDTEADPHQLRNLAMDPACEAELKRMREALRGELLRTRDLGFLPEQMVNERRASDPPMLMAADDQRYPLERIIAAAELVGDAEAISRQIKLLGDSEPAIRYWAAVGLMAAATIESSGLEALETTIRDTNPSVRIESAGAILQHITGSHPEALQALIAELRCQKTECADARIHAARTLELLENKARGAKPDLLEVWQEVRNATLANDHALFLRFSVGAALRNLGEPIPWNPQF